MNGKYWMLSCPSDAYIIHSSGPWEKHKYIKVEGGKYTYPEDQKNGQVQKAQKPAQQTINKITPKQQNTQAKTATPTTKTDAQKKTQTTTDKNNDKHISEMATSVIRGKYGVGEERKKKLRASGESWERIQNKVNEMLGSKVRHKVPDEDSSSDKTSSTKRSSKSTRSTSKRKRSSSSSSKKSTGSRKRKSSSKSSSTATGTKRKRRSAKTMTLQELADYGNTYVRDALEKLK